MYLDKVGTKDLQVVDIASNIAAEGQPKPDDKIQAPTGLAMTIAVPDAPKEDGTPSDNSAVLEWDDDFIFTTDQRYNAIPLEAAFTANQILTDIQFEEDVHENAELQSFAT
jgi:hypothetical protein